MSLFKSSRQNTESNLKSSNIPINSKCSTQHKRHKRKLSHFAFKLKKVNNFMDEFRSIKLKFDKSLNTMTARTRIDTKQKNKHQLFDFNKIKNTQRKSKIPCFKKFNK